MIPVETATIKAIDVAAKSCLLKVSWRPLFYRNWIPELPGLVGPLLLLWGRKILFLRSVPNVRKTK